MFDTCLVSRAIHFKWFHEIAVNNKYNYFSKILSFPTSCEGPCLPIWSQGIETRCHRRGLPPNVVFDVIFWFQMISWYTGAYSVIVVVSCYIKHSCVQAKNGMKEVTCSDYSIGLVPINDTLIPIMIRSVHRLFNGLSSTHIKPQKSRSVLIHQA